MTADALDLCRAQNKELRTQRDEARAQLAEAREAWERLEAENAALREIAEHVANEHARREGDVIVCEWCGGEAPTPRGITPETWKSAQGKINHENDCPVTKARALLGQS